MVNALGIIAALILGVSIYLSLENQTQYRAQITERQRQESLLAQAQQKLKDTQQQVKEAEEDLEDKEGTLAQLKEDLSAQEEVVADLEGDIDDKKLVINTRKEELAEVEKVTRDLGEADELIADVKRYQLERDELKTEISTAEAKRGGLDNTSQNLEESISAARGTINLYSKQISNPELVTNIGQVYGGFGFVTLRDGDNKGVIKGSTLDVIRGGETIAKLLVSTVENSTSAANVIPGSLAPDTNVRPGDKVIPTAQVTQ